MIPQRHTLAWASPVAETILRVSIEVVNERSSAFQQSPVEHRIYRRDHYHPFFININSIINLAAPQEMGTVEKRAGLNPAAKVFFLSFSERGRPSSHNCTQLLSKVSMSLFRKRQTDRTSNTCQVLCISYIKASPLRAQLSQLSTLSWRVGESYPFSNDNNALDIKAGLSFGPRRQLL